LSAAAYSVYSQLPSIAGGRPFHPQPEDTPCCGDNIVVTTTEGTKAPVVLKGFLLIQVFGVVIRTNCTFVYIIPDIKAFATYAFMNHTAAKEL
jgi:hypothetical protein